MGDVKIGDKIYGDMPELKKVEDYLYEITIDEIDENYYKEVLGYPMGGCSEIRNGDFIGRNYDWKYSNDCEFVVRTLPRKDRCASIGISSVKATEQELSNGIYNEKLKDVPKILETPYVQDKAPYKFEIEMIRSGKFNPNLIDDIINS